MSNAKLPEKWVSEGLVLAEGATLFGALLTDLSREELLAAVAHGWALEKQARIREVEAVKRALEVAVRQNEHDMLMTGEELRACRKALEA